MATKLLVKCLQYIRRSASRRPGDEQTDGLLLEAFIRGRDSLALEALVRRHAPMVWGVCRRRLANYHDAEDAFQATFLVLVRKAASIRSRDLLANWLYGVAQKTSRKARQLAAKRPKQGPMPEPQTEPHDPEFGPELRALLDEELSRLPDKYRIAIVLCDLEERNRADVAQQLRLPEGTVGSRLARGRALLAKRLSRRGLTVSATSLTVLLPQQASAFVPAALLVSTIKSATLLAVGEAAAAVSAPVAALTTGVLKTMALAKQKAAGALLLTAALVLCAGMVSYHVLAGQPSEPGNKTSLLKTEVKPKAGAIMMAFTATVAQVADPHRMLDGSVKVGEQVTGMYIFDPSAPDSNADPTVGDYRHTGAGYGIRVKVGNYLFKTDPSNVDFLLEVVSRPADHAYLLRSYNNVVFGPRLREACADHISWQLNDPKGLALSGDRLPLDPPRLAAWQSDVGLTITGGAGRRKEFLIRAHVVDVHKVQ